MKYIIVNKIHKEFTEEAKKQISDNIKNHLSNESSFDEHDEYYNMPKSKVRELGLSPSSDEDSLFEDSQILHFNIPNPYIESERKKLVNVASIISIEEIDETFSLMFTTEDFPFKIKNSLSEITKKIELLKIKL